MSIIFKKAMYIANNYDVSTEPNSLVLFSISKLTTKENKNNAFKCVENNPEKQMMDHTPCGKALENLNLFSEDNGVSYDDAYKVWFIASKRLIDNASGNITAFVANAHPDSTYRKIELPAILQNDKITTINNQDKWTFEKFVTSNYEWYKEKSSNSIQSCKEKLVER